ncbi:energy-coupling factor transporter transmembrane protein EcfT [Corynebacterium mastitidis]|uniref:energy-coupling factor transporter transmembrane component T family protein n=1 Tax=Corynebacterium mastitidis TaxID=161890 RepID=UPI0012FE9746|nr:energy-coupling factor transporter transmembrane component T [Corynebacterium mastitidis]MCH6196325.1 energy-coupling factor transporter transmembrane protein EcfT [Corynebacterium mastitidis]
MPDTPGRGAPVHPFTCLSLAACGWVLAVGLNTAWVSLALILLSWGAGALAGGRPRWRVAAWSLALSAPVAVSMLIIHAPHGRQRIAPLLSGDGLLLALVLSLRFTALVSTVLAAVAWMRVADLAKALQASGAPSALAYAVAATLQLAPQARAAARTIREANALAGRSVRGLRAVPGVAVPLVVVLMGRAARSGETLAALGVGEKGPRTVLRPVPDSAVQRCLRWLAPVCCAVAVAGRAAL